MQDAVTLFPYFPSEIDFSSTKCFEILYFIHIVLSYTTLQTTTIDKIDVIPIIQYRKVYMK